MKRKRIVVANANIPDGNYTPSDSDSDDEVSTRKIARRPSNTSDGPSNMVQGHREVNRQFLLEALNKIHELENELAELDDLAGYDSGHQDDDDNGDTDEGNGSDFEENNQQPIHEPHNHLNDILNGEPEALGFAFCIKETFDYLASQGVSADSPIFAALRERFLDHCDDA